MKTKAPISFAFSAKLICAFGFVYADCWFSHEAAQMYDYHYAFQDSAPCINSTELYP